jgi:hypothetical protein
VIYNVVGSNSSRSAIFTPYKNFALFGGGEVMFQANIKLSVLATAAEDYDYWIGFGDQHTGNEQTDGVYLKYSRATSVNWIMGAANNGTQTLTPSSTPVTAGGEFQQVRIIVNAAGTQASYYIDGVNIGTVTSNIPVTVGRESGALVVLVKTASAASTEVKAYTDYIWVKQQFTRSR